MSTDTIELPLMHWIWVTALAGVISNIAWELFTYFGHATVHSLASAWHEFKKLPAHVFSLHAPLRVAGVVLTALALISLAQATGRFEFAAVPMQLIELYRSFAHGVGDTIFAAIINESTRTVAYDVIVAALLMIFVIWRTASGWRHYSEFNEDHDGVSLGAYFGLQLMAGLGAVVIALAVIETLQ